MYSLQGDLEQTKSGATVSTSFSYPLYQAMKNHGEAFENVTAFDPEVRTFVSAVNSKAEPVSVQMVSGNFFATFRIIAVLGRTLLPADDIAVGSGPVVEISDSYWAQRFGRSPQVIGKVIELNGIPVTVVGITPRGFTGPRPGKSPDIYLPLTMQPVVEPLVVDPLATDGNNQFTDGEHWWVAVIARVKPHVTDAQALASLEGVFVRTAKDTMDKHHDNLDQLRLNISPGSRGLVTLSNEFSQTAHVLLAVVGLVLLLACANVANLLLARSASRNREVSIRIALGAGRSRIMRQVLTENMLLALLGGGAGLILGYLGRDLVPHVLHQNVTVNFDWQVMAFTFAISLVTGLLFGGLPAWRTTLLDMQSGLQDTARGTLRKSKTLLGKSLVVLQVCLSTVLLIGAGLFLRTLHNLNHAQLGFQPERLLLFDLSVLERQYTNQETRSATFDQLKTQIAALPGVKMTTFSEAALLAGDTSTTNFDPNGETPRSEKAWLNAIGDNYFETMGIPLVAGRAFSNEDTATGPKVAVINLRLAHQFFPNENPIGRTFNDDHIRIVGIGGDAKFKDLRMEPPPTYYRPYRQSATSNSVTFAVKAAVMPSSLTEAVRSVVLSLDKDLLITNMRTQDEQINDSLREERLFATLTTGFGLLALLLASIGVYGITAYTVSRRTNEIGIRMALGAQRPQVLRMVLREACWLAAAGVGTGLAISLVVGHLVRSLLYDLRSSDPLTLATAGTILIAVILVASWMPARRAASLHPMKALRHE